MRDLWISKINKLLEKASEEVLEWTYYFLRRLVEHEKTPE